MAGRQRQIAHQDDEPETLDADFRDVSAALDEQERIENEINAEINAATGDVRHKVKVYQIDPKGNDMDFLFDLMGESTEGLAERLRDEYGTGKYLARVYRDDGDGKGFIMRRTRAFRVKAPKQAVVAAPPPDHGGSALVAAVSQQGQILQALVAQLSQMKAVPSQQMDFNGIAALITAVGSLQPKTQQSENPLKMITEVLSIAREIGDSGREKGMFDILGDVLQSPLFAKAVEGAQQQQPQIQRQQRPQIPSPQNQPATGSVKTSMEASPSNPSPAPSQNEDEQKFAQLLALLITRAMNNSDPYLYADFVEDMVGKEAIKGLLLLPDPVGALASYNPTVTTYRGWFVSLVEALTDQGEEEQEDSRAPDLPSPAQDATGRDPAPVDPAVTS